MTTVILQTRAEWGAVPPESVLRLNWSKVDKFIVHYSGASRLQTVRSIQRFCMETKGHSDIDYNSLVRRNVLYVGRGVNVGSHTLGNNSTSYGVCMIGVDGDATPDDFNVIRNQYDYACQMAGRELRMLGHQQAPGLPAGYTTCPGSQLQNWINQGMPYVEPRKAVDMFMLQDDETGAIYTSSGINTRHLPEGTYETTVLPLHAAGVPWLHYANLDAVIAAGGPLIHGQRPIIEAPTVAKISFPPGTVTLE